MEQDGQPEAQDAAPGGRHKISNLLQDGPLPWHKHAVQPPCRDSAKAGLSHADPKSG